MATASFYDGKKVGDVGPLGFRRSTDLSKLVDCIGYLIDNKILIPDESLFLDLGCADGRVNVLFSYLTRASIGIELDEWSLDEYIPLKEELEKVLSKIFQRPIILQAASRTDRGCGRELQRRATATRRRCSPDPS